MAKRLSGGQPGTNGRADDPETVLEESAFRLERRHERRIHSWSPDPFDEPEQQEAEPADEGPPAAEDLVEPVRERTALREAPRAPAPVTPRPTAGAPARSSEAARPSVRPQADPAAATAATLPPRAATSVPEPGLPARKRGRPRGRVVRRQVHFHVSPDEEELLMAAVQMFGSQQKGLVAALQSLQEAELLRDEIDRLTAECERQRELLAEAEALFKR